ncbi:MAG: YcaO-like family protein [Pseudonocardiaceae bacterium]
MTGADLDQLVDSRYGLITRVVRQPRPAGLPGTFEAYSAEVADTRTYASWHADPYAFGASLIDPQEARTAAIGEAVERYCGNAVPPDLLLASYDQLVSDGAQALDPAALVLYSEEQYRQPGFPFLPFGRDLPVRWISSWDVATGDEVLVPASLVYLNYHQGRYGDEPRTHFMILPGIAAGPDLDHAVRRACAELVERDAVTLWWQRGCSVTAVAPDGEGFPATLLVTADDAPAPDYHLFRVPSDFGATVFGALLDDRDSGVVSMGSACHPHPRVAAVKALTEALQLRAFSLDLLDPMSPVWREIQAGARNTGIVRPYRADRAYLEAGCADFSDVLDFAGHAQLYLDPRMRGQLTRILAPAQHESLPAQNGTDPLDLLVGQGFQVLAVNLTTSDVTTAGCHVVRVIVPGLYPSAPAAFPFLGGSRLYHGPDGPLTGADLVLVPAPTL